MYWNESTIKIPGLSLNPDGATPEIKDSMDAPIPPNLIHIQPYLASLKTCFNSYTDKYNYSTGQNGYSIQEQINIQHYKVGGGFKAWHYERGNSNPVIVKRHLVFMTYLNDVDDGGTEFFYQNMTVKAEKGLTLIWPADWTHTHRGQISHTKEKTIITGWFSLN
jgi:hypothetical protein